MQLAERARAALPMRMALTYFKRYRMEIDLVGRSVPWPVSIGCYRLLPWEVSLLEAHAEAKFQSFRDEIDVNLFPCFRDLAGCRRLMTEISRKPGFLPGATWLVVRNGQGGDGLEPCGTVQGVRDTTGMGAIQNLGITPPHRNHGLGSALMHGALRGFQQAGLKRAYLEVTAENKMAIRLYRRLGFHIMKTVFKTGEVVCT